MTNFRAAATQLLLAEDPSAPLSQIEEAIDVLVAQALEVNGDQVLAVRYSDEDVGDFLLALLTASDNAQMQIS